MSKKKNKNNVFSEIDTSENLQDEAYRVSKLEANTDRITPRELTIFGSMWFAIDKFGYIVCCYTKTWHVPVFFIKSYTESEILYDYFSKFVLQGEFSEVEIEENNIFCYELIDEYYFEFIKSLDTDRSEFKKKTKRHNKKQGLQVRVSKLKEENIDRSDFKNHPYHYKKINNPTNPIHFDQLPENIRKIMDSHRMTIDAHNTKYFFIPEIYKDVSGTINKEARNNKLVCKPMRER